MSFNKKCQIISKWVMWGSRVALFEFWEPLISRERLKLETSNLARRQKTVSFNEEMQKRSCVGHVTHLRNFGTPNMLRTV